MTDSVPPGPGGEVNRPAESGHRLVEASLSPNTRRAYRGALRQLDAWLEGRPLDDATLAVYLGALHEAGRAPATAALVVAATAFRARLSGLPPPGGARTGRALAEYRRNQISVPFAPCVRSTGRRLDDREPRRLPRRSPRRRPRGAALLRRRPKDVQGASASGTARAT